MYNRSHYEKIIEDNIQHIKIVSNHILNDDEDRYIRSELFHIICNIFLGSGSNELNPGESAIGKIESKVYRLNPFSGSVYDSSAAGDYEKFMKCSQLEPYTFSENTCVNLRRFVSWSISLESMKFVASNVWGNETEIIFMQ